ncbi:hypothetical protein HYH02_014163 [Chlamydomonas schloesseri]|uniref:Non-specific serine/threonine protein kinase n=1 Tax=Chlamydomonas schloesseri TaxID=2026947 RepID=A0A835T078_9CHLO|nr:hypothetical protein HYH02_014163 [Chlamydomonas schloesseri]|eukprot:KAG2429126.1 hypothetical protein HYH02_014163 [Chlamydomonas schloesseri]
MGLCASKANLGPPDSEQPADSAASLTATKPAGSSPSAVSASPGSAQLKAAALKTAWQTSARSLRASITKRSAKRSDSYKLRGGGAASPDDIHQRLQQPLHEAGIDRDSAGNGGNAGRASGIVPLRVNVGARVSPTDAPASASATGGLRVSPATQPLTPGAAPAARRSSSSALAGYGAPDGVATRTYSTSHGGAANGTTGNANGAGSKRPSVPSASTGPAGHAPGAADTAGAAGNTSAPGECEVQSFCRPSEAVSDGAGVDGPDSFGPEELTSLPPPRSCPNCYTPASPTGAPATAGGAVAAVVAGLVGGSVPLASACGARRSNSNLAAVAPRDASVTGRQAAARRGSAGAEAAWAAAPAALVVPPSPRPAAAAQPPASPAAAAPPSPASAATAAAQKAQAKAAAAAAAAVASAGPTPAAAAAAAAPPSPKPAAAAAAADATTTTWVLRPGPPVESAYELGDVLGKGSFGVVRRARHIASGAQVAIKTIKKSLLGAGDVAALRREVEILHHLSGHPHISQLLGVFEEPGQLHLVLELYQGGDLFDAIISVGRHSERAAADVMRTVLTAIAYCHAMGVAHRDIKPENFMLTAPPPPREALAGGPSPSPSPSGLHADSLAALAAQLEAEAEAADPELKGAVGSRLKLIDFGLSVFCSDATPLSDTVGTSYYVAPEVLAKSYSRAADVWSAGVILHILLTGYAPFDGRNDQEILKAVQQGQLDLTSDPIWSSISREAMTALTSMLDRDPQRRATADQLLAMPWFGRTAAACAAPATPLPGVVSERMRRFARMNSFQKEARRVVAGLMRREEVAGLVAQFKSLDADGDGKLCVEELQAGLARQEMRGRASASGLVPAAVGGGAGAAGALTAEEMRQLVERSDLNGDGLLDESEFLGAALPTAVIARQAQAALAAAQQAAAAGGGGGGRPFGGGSRPGTSSAAGAGRVGGGGGGVDPGSNPLAAAFAYFDADGSGYITIDELRSALAAHHPAGEGPDIRALLCRVDADSDGRISYPEFLAMMAAECLAEEEEDGDEQQAEEGEEGEGEGRSRCGRRRSKGQGGMQRLRGANAVGGGRSRASSSHSHHSGHHSSGHHSGHHHSGSPHGHKMHGNEPQWPAARGLTGQRSKKSTINAAGARSGHHGQQQPQQHGGAHSRPSTTQTQAGHRSRDKRQSGRQQHQQQHASNPHHHVDEQEDNWFEDEEVLPAEDPAAAAAARRPQQPQQEQLAAGGTGARSGRSRGGQRVTLHMTPSQEERQQGVEEGQAAPAPPQAAAASAWGGRSRNGRDNGGACGHHHNGGGGHHGAAAGGGGGPSVRGHSAATSYGSTAVVPSLSGRLSPLDGTGWYDECNSPGGVPEDPREAGGEGAGEGEGADDVGWERDGAMAGALAAALGGRGAGDLLMQQVSVEDSGLGAAMVAQQWNQQQQQQQAGQEQMTSPAARRPPALMIPSQPPVATQRSRRHSATAAIPGTDAHTAAAAAAAGAGVSVGGGGYAVASGAATDRPPRVTAQPVLPPAPNSGEVPTAATTPGLGAGSVSSASAAQARGARGSQQMQQLLLSQIGGDGSGSGGSGRSSMPASPSGHAANGAGSWFYSPAASPSGRATAQRMLRNELAAASATTAAQYYGGAAASGQRQPLTPEQLLMPAPPPSLATGPVAAAGARARGRRQSTGSPAWPLTQPSLAGCPPALQQMLQLQLQQPVSPLSPRLGAAFASTGYDPSGRRQPLQPQPLHADAQQEQQQHQHHGGLMLPPGACLDPSEHPDLALQPVARGSGGSTPRGRQQQQQLQQLQGQGQGQGQLQSSPQHMDMLTMGGGGSGVGPCSSGSGRAGYISEPLPQLHMTGTSTVVGGRLATPALGAACSPRQPRPPSGAPWAAGAGAGGRQGAGVLPPWGEEVDL